MRRSDHPSRPSAITCCRFSALKTLPIPAAGVQPTAQVNVSAPGAALAGFQVSINGRFWVSTEVWGYWKHHELPNLCPKSFGELSHHARAALRRMRRRPTLVAAFWQQAELFV